MRHNQRNAGCRRRSTKAAAGALGGAEDTVGAMSGKATGSDERLCSERGRCVQRPKAPMGRQRCVAGRVNLAHGS